MTSIDPVFSALADPTRREIVEMLASRDPMTVNEIACHFDMTRQAVAKHLKVLRDTHVIEGEQQGREHLHSLAPNTMMTLTEWVEHYSQFWDERLNTLKTMAEEDHSNDRS